MSWLWWLLRLLQIGPRPTALVVEPLLFDTLDIHPILRKILHNLAALAPAANIRWVLADHLPALLHYDVREIRVAAGGALGAAPHTLAVHEQHTTEFLWSLRERLGVQLPLEDSQWIPRSEGGVDLCLRVGDEGLFYFENVTDRETALARVQEYLRSVHKYIQFAYQHFRAVELAYFDSLTNLGNHRHLRRVLDQEIGHAARPFAVLLLDLDYFRSVNESKGHWVGSKVLVAFGELLGSCIRTCDFGFRYGGDEFVVVLPETNAEGARVVAERIRQNVEAFHFLIEGNEIQLTVSIGLACYPEHATTSEQILQMADRAMYSGKHKSRNIVYIAN
jgi:diguanylate cyclase (GGDEF)-like protein